MEMVIIGSGNVATVLGHCFQDAGHRIRQVYSREEAHAARLGEELGCQAVSGWEELTRDADVYLVALSDDALRGLGGHLSLPGKLVLHTAGAVPGKVLLDVSVHSGVLYPLQSLRREIRPYPEIPILIDANQPGDLERIAGLARSISGQVTVADDEQRLKLHLAAILVNNFTNHLYTLAADYCKAEGADFSMLLPLIRTTTDRLTVTAPAEAQTGPAKRGDLATIQRHLTLIDNYKDIKEVYALMTQQIMERSRRGF